MAGKSPVFQSNHNFRSKAPYSPSLFLTGTPEYIRKNYKSQEAYGMHFPAGRQRNFHRPPAASEMYHRQTHPRSYGAGSASYSRQIRNSHHEAGSPHWEPIIMVFMINFFCRRCLICLACCLCACVLYHLRKILHFHCHPTASVSVHYPGLLHESRR